MLSKSVLSQLCKRTTTRTGMRAMSSLGNNNTDVRKAEQQGDYGVA
jgi:hypothetical protein